jgi:hypothetical protein
LGFFVFNCNRISARELNRERMGHRLQIQAALEAGLLQEVPADAVVEHSDVAEWLIPACTEQYAHRQVRWEYRDPSSARASGAFRLQVDASGGVSLQRPILGETR